MREGGGEDAVGGGGFWVGVVRGEGRVVTGVVGPAWGRVIVDALALATLTGCPV